VNGWAETLMLTELEGAILAEIHNGGHETAFQVRRAFANSLSLEWKGKRRRGLSGCETLAREKIHCAVHPHMTTGVRADCGLLPAGKPP